jgi:hypothetical protein
MTEIRAALLVVDAMQQSAEGAKCNSPQSAKRDVLGSRTPPRFFAL